MDRQRMEFCECGHRQQGHGPNGCRMLICQCSGFRKRAALIKQSLPSTAEIAPDRSSDFVARLLPRLNQGHGLRITQTPEGICIQCVTDEKLEARGSNLQSALRNLAELTGYSMER